MSVPDWAPSIDDVAALLQSRTGVDLGEGAGTFTDATSPSAALVSQLIEQAVLEVDDIIGRPIPDRYQDEASRLAARRAAALIVLSLDEDSAEPTAQGRSYNAMWLEGIERLAERLRPPVFLA